MITHLSFVACGASASNSSGASDAPGGVATSAPDQVDLIDYISSHSVNETLADLESEVESYNRALHFGDWINDDPENDCYDVRHEVLLRDADQSKPITFRADNKCKVLKAFWNDPYSGTLYKTAASIQVDHMVPLKHTYLTGGHAWRPSKRCNYSNFLANSFHLKAVSGHENMSKGDRSPVRYMPPNKSYQCEYIADWIKVKAVWELVATKDEVEAIKAVAAERGCSKTVLSISNEELDRQRRKTRELPAKCLEFEDIVQMLPITY
ncbi:MAG: DUF1524 domain-containing protein [Bdellovibrionota bacterium]